jgi:hypothetical protein
MPREVFGAIAAPEQFGRFRKVPEFQLSQNFSLRPRSRRKVLGSSNLRNSPEPAAASIQDEGARGFAGPCSKSLVAAAAATPRQCAYPAVPRPPREPPGGVSHDFNCVSAENRRSPPLRYACFFQFFGR